MAGYICKIVMENTHPPVWRRVLIPDKITFEELHEIIQILFGWDNEHLHDFRIPADRIAIGLEEDTWEYDYHEEETLIDSFFRNYKWIRYTYDFGDNWQHKINVEKLDENYTGREAVLLKFKGDNFEEDSGGIWWAGDTGRRAFDETYVKVQLEHMELPRHEELQETKLLRETVKDMATVLQDFLQLKPEVIRSQFAQVADDLIGECSAMTKKIEAWKQFEQGSWEGLKIAVSAKSQKEILMDLGAKEAADYYKYLRISKGLVLSREEQVKSIADTLREHPEYLLYIFDENEYRELSEWFQHASQKRIPQKSKYRNMLIKALSLGLVDFVSEEKCQKLCFASDVEQFIGVVDTTTKKRTYKALSDYDNKMGKLMQVYGLIELENLYMIYKKMYDVNIDKEDFFRYVYWHSRFNDMVNTAYQLDGTCYVAQKEIEAQNVLEQIGKYSQDLPYVVYSRQEIERMAGDLCNRSEWVDIFYTTLHYQLGMNEFQAQNGLVGIIIAIFNGYTLNEIIQILEEQSNKEWDVEVAVELWLVLLGLMVELELPMLKGRSRMQYAEEQKCSVWTLGMLDGPVGNIHTKQCHMYQFPIEVQEWMYEVYHCGVEEQINKLLSYKEQNHVCSEEYFYLLADGCIMLGQKKIARKLIEQLKSSSSQGRRVATHLETRLHERYDVADDEDWFEKEWMEKQTMQQPYVRSAPKIGRNEQCPCGSGKKYKKCCGKNNSN